MGSTVHVVPDLHSARFWATSRLSPFTRDDDDDDVNDGTEKFHYFWKKGLSGKPAEYLHSSD